MEFWREGLEEVRMCSSSIVCGGCDVYFFFVIKTWALKVKGLGLFLGGLRMITLWVGRYAVGKEV